IESAIQNINAICIKNYKYILEKDIRPMLIGAAARHSAFEVQIPGLGAST
ncbi:Hypothetical protein FKW44_021192, partial [Caligus rogercresseyi]